MFLSTFMCMMIYDMYMKDLHVIDTICWLVQLWVRVGLDCKIRWDVYVNVMLYDEHDFCRVIWLSKVMGLCLVISLVDMIGVHG